MKIDKILATLILALGMVLSGCGKQPEETKKTKKKTKTEATTEKVVTSTTTHGIELVEDQTTTTETEVVEIPFARLDKEAVASGAYDEVVQEMIADFNEKLPEQVNTIQTFHVSRIYGLAILHKDGYGVTEYEQVVEDYDISVSEISIENVYLYKGADYKPIEENSKLPSGIVLVMRVELKIKGTNVETGEEIEDIFPVATRICNFDMTVDDTLTKVIGHGTIDCDFSYINVACERIIFDSYESLKCRDMTKIYEYTMGTNNNKLTGLLMDYHKAFWGEMYKQYHCGSTDEYIESASGIAWKCETVEAKPSEAELTLPDDC